MIANMHLHTSNRRKSSDSALSASSITPLDESILKMTLPLAPREDDYNMSEKTLQARLFAKCKRTEKGPWKDARPLPVQSLKKRRVSVVAEMLGE